MRAVDRRGPGVRLAVAAEVDRPRVVDRRVHLLRGDLGRRDEAVERHVLESVQTALADARFLQHGVGEPRREVGSQQASHGAALDDRLVKQAPCPRHGHQGGHLPAAAGLAEDRHVRGIAAEARDVVPHPLERGDDVEQTHVSRCRVLLAADGREVEEADRADAVVEADDDDIVACEVLSVVDVHLVAGAGGEAAAVQPDHDGALATVEAGSPDVQAQTVFALRAGVPFVDEGHLVLVPMLGRNLRAREPPGERRANAGPRRRFRGRHEAPGAGGGRSIGNAPEDERLPVPESAHLPVGRAGDGGGVRSDEGTGGRGPGGRSRLGGHSPREKACGGRAGGGLHPGTPRRFHRLLPPEMSTVVSAAERDARLQRPRRRKATPRGTRRRPPGSKREPSARSASPCMR